MEPISCLLEESPTVSSVAEVSRPLEGKRRHRKRGVGSCLLLGTRVASLSGSSGIGKRSSDASCLESQQNSRLDWVRNETEREGTIVMPEFLS